MKSGKAWITVAVLASFVLDGCGTQRMVKPTDNTITPEAASGSAENIPVIPKTPEVASQNVAKGAGKRKSKRIRVIESSSIASGVANSATISAKAGAGKRALGALGFLAIIAVAYALMRRKGSSGTIPPQGGSSGQRGAQMSAGSPQGGVSNTGNQAGSSTGPPGPSG